MPMIPVDTAVVITVGPLFDDTDFKTLETGVAYNAPGMSVDLIKSPLTGAGSKTDLTLTSGGSQDWTELGNGMYEIEITAAQNNTEGELQIVGVADGILPFISAKYQVVPEQVWNSLVGNLDYLDVNMAQLHGNGSAASNLMNSFFGSTFPNVEQFFENSGMLVLGTTLLSVTSQTQIVLADGSTKDDAYNGLSVLLMDAGVKTDRCVRTVEDDDGATKTLTLDSAPDFTIAASDGVFIHPTQSNLTRIGGSVTAAASLKQQCLSVPVAAVATAAGDANTATAFDTDLPTENDDYYGSADGGSVVAFVDAKTNQYQFKRIVASTTVSGNTRITLEEALDAIPSDGDVFVLFGRITELT